jgi:hypothetical protein
MGVPASTVSYPIASRKVREQRQHHRRVTSKPSAGLRDHQRPLPARIGP